MKPIHHAPSRLNVPAGFSGWWCGRCECAVNVDPELGSPARCPKCHKPTAIWIPPSDAVAVPEPNQVPEPPPRTRPTKERAAEWFAQMRAHVENPETPVEPPAATENEDWQSGL